jgi:DNA-binding HxlR family transcriptional regulator
MVNKFYVYDEELIFSLSEEPDFFRMKIERPNIEEDHVEEFMDKTVEWLSTNPEKGILIDFEGVRSVCSEFTVYLSRYYQDIKARGLNVRFVNVPPGIEPFIDVSNITIVMSLPAKPVVSARQLLLDLRNNLTDRQLMRKHGLSKKGLASLFRKLVQKKLITRKELAKRMGIETCEITTALDGLGKNKLTIEASEVLKDLSEEITDEELMRKYKLSHKGLQSLMRKLYQKGLVTKQDILTRQRLPK